MFILRRCLKSGLRHNFELGKHYTIIDRETDQEEFKRELSTLNLSEEENKSQDRHEITHFILGDGVRYTVYINDDAYIMTSTGTTFEKLY